MSIFTALRDRFSTSETSAGQSGDPHGDSAAGSRVPFDGYDRLDDRAVMDKLSDRSQVELESVEAYERSHKNRTPVLDKLRYMRGSEPVPGYDALSVEEILAMLKEADMATIKKVRGYERKFANRPEVLDEVIRVHHRRQAAEPAAPAPAYQPLSTTSASSAPSAGS